MNIRKINNRIRMSFRIGLLNIFLMLCLAMSYISTQGLAFAQQNDQQTPLDPVTLQLKWKHQFQFAGYYAAIEKGYYREAGLDVALREAQPDEVTADAVLNGQAEFGIASSDLVLLRGAGKPVVVLAPIFQHSPLIFLVPEDSGMTSIHDLKGRPVMLETHAEELLAYLMTEGLSPQDVTLVPHTSDVSKILDGTVSAMSAYLTDEPFLLEQSGIRYLWFTPRSAGIDFYGDTLFTTEKQVKKHPDRVRRFREASLKGWDYALRHPEEMVDLILSQYSRRHSREHLLFEAEKTAKLILPDVVEVGYSNPGRWRHIAQTYTTSDMMPHDFSTSGFLYEHGVKINLRKFYIALSIALGIVAILSVAVVWITRVNRKIRKQARSLEKALGEIKVLRGIIPICASCKKIRDDKGYWNQVEQYISERTDVEFSHGICADCARKLYPHLYKDNGEMKTEHPGSD